MAETKMAEVIGTNNNKSFNGKLINNFFLAIPLPSTILSFIFVFFSPGQLGKLSCKGPKQSTKPTGSNISFSKMLLGQFGACITDTAGNKFEADALQNAIFFFLKKLKKI